MASAGRHRARIEAITLRYAGEVEVSAPFIVVNTVKGNSKYHAAARFTE